MKLFCSFAKFILISAAFVLVTGLPANLQAATPEKAKAYVEELGDKAVAIVTSKGSDDASKRKNLMDLMRNNIDFNWVGKFVMGRHWKTATEEQKKRYLELYREFLLKSYTSKVQEYTSVSFNIINTESQNGKEFVVHTEIKRESDSPIKVDYRLLEDGPSKFKIIDMVVEGVSLLTTQRSEFNSVISRDGVDKLNDMLEKRVQEL